MIACNIVKSRLGSDSVLQFANDLIKPVRHGLVGEAGKMTEQDDG